ncbi:putative oxidant-induced cell-cycle arrest protein [Clavispora lusitaniae]|uniref:Oxidant-induced cell-cycle arrest protein n=1 Tax=Clavispora lusitaniae TaxID=36911 RepID=A0ACD0WT46_CLALS|nr:putative oxidant-induced cell-cycle arrest protein [Clavispora lusitaniae]QFZ35911.1 putative oxidant-induced cell-cycle arrest protein [Clavispora lusitaniae]QFZ41593.1 putative oxidant-induced cell-cycle arrest protein [Clavispora lusitaniae]QFZ47271.1 putative oxidant-induced cell-cycle arrest protein [Clavispora lusitaniae]QFZ52948.1 putative oxidant-induced cell-cycle arrest protein [Clavispora lusitaniae]
MSSDLSEPSNSSRKSSAGSSGTVKQTAVFHYNSEIFAQCQSYLSQKNYHGLALIARQKGLPPFLRFKIWPILLRSHPFVVNPFLQPDAVEKERPPSDGESEDPDAQLQRRIRKDLRRYLHRITYSSAEEPLSQTESQMFDILEKAVHKFVLKWGRIIKYDPALTWMALGVAEWFPPIPNTHWVLLGRDVTSSTHTCIGSVFEGYESFIDSAPGLSEFLQSMVQEEVGMRFHEVYERLALVLLHSPESANKRDKPGNSVKINKSTLPVSGGTIEQRVSFFIYVFQKLLPELSSYFQEEQILNKFGSNDDEWLIWWLKYCGSKVWSRVDRGRIWDLMLGWRMQSKKSEADRNYYADKLNISSELLDKLGPDSFWSVDYVEEERLIKEDSFKDLINDLHIDSCSNQSSSSSGDSSPVLSSSSRATSTGYERDQQIPFARIDPHIELLFVSLALLKAKENTLVELDQHEIRTFLSHLPAKSFSLSDKYKQYQEQKDKEKGTTPMAYGVFTHDYMDRIISEAGELWRKWLWLEMSGES